MENGGKYQKLIQRNPFYIKPVAPPPPPVAAVHANYDFTGFVTVGDVVQVGILDKTKNVGYLLKVGQSQPTEDNQDELTVESIDTEAKKVTLRTRNQNLSLSLMDVSTSDSSMASLSPPPFQSIPGMPYPGSVPGSWPPGMPSPVPQPNWMPGMPPGSSSPFGTIPFGTPGMPNPTPSPLTTAQSGSSQSIPPSTPRPRIRRPIRVPSNR